MAFAFSFKASAQQCDFTLELTDSWGDGWNGVSSMDVYVGGVLVFDDIQAIAGAGGGTPTVENVTFTVNPGDDIYTVFNTAAEQGFPDYASECSYRILNNAGIQVGAGDSLNDILTGTISAVCVTCDAPVTSYAAVSNCPVDNGFSIDVTVSNIGAASGVTISDDQGTTPLAGVAAGGPYNYGSYANATPVVITVTNDDDGSCFALSSALTFDGDCPPANDDCSGAISIACGDVVAYDTTNATLDAGNAVECGTVALSPDVWYTFQGTGTPDTVTLSTCNDAAYDTKIFVYSGTCGALVCEANNDDGAGCAGFTSQLEFTSDGTTVYYISVNGYTNGIGTSQGTGNLTISCVPAVTPPANNDCANAQSLTFGLTATGDNTNATNAIANPSCDTFGIISDVWYTFVGPATGEVTLTTTTGSTDNAWIAVYDACGGNELGCASGATVVGGGDGQPGGKQLELTDLVNGTTYLVQVWNDGAALRRIEGTFNITVVEGLLSTQDFDNELEFSYYPNPVNDNLSLNAQRAIQNVSIYNMLGQEVLRATPNAVNTEMNMSGLQSGAYFVKVTIEDVTETVRIIKN